MPNDWPEEILDAWDKFEMSSNGWIGVDLDGTLAEYYGWRDMHIGQPIAPMLARVKQWLVEGRTVKIFTARVGPAIASPHNGMTPEADSQRKLIGEWCEKHIGHMLEVTATKDFAMIELWDDRAKQVVPNEGHSVEEQRDLASLAAQNLDRELFRLRTVFTNELFRVQSTARTQLEAAKKALEEVTPK